MSKKKTPPSPETLGLPLAGADSHAHLGSPPLWNDREGVMARARAAGVASIGQIFLRHRSYLEQKDWFSSIPGIAFILGLHPEDLPELEENEFELIRSDIQEDLDAGRKIKAVGEIGLDYFWKNTPHDMQTDYFAGLLGMARDFKLPVVIHCRDAEEDCFAILENNGFKKYPLLWHCFGGDQAMAERILANGWHISVPGPLTYKANGHVREALKYIWETAPDRFMLETDCPYLAPEPWRGHTNEPALTAFTCAAAADFLGVDRAELWTRCGDTMRRFFAL
ncbi:MAG: TatD family hydrolase [Mailhella sp.]|nr:TatD family hydrolase [Mailhella sp.]